MELTASYSLRPAGFELRCNKQPASAATPQLPASQHVSRLLLPFCRIFILVIGHLITFIWQFPIRIGQPYLPSLNSGCGPPIIFVRAVFQATPSAESSCPSFSTSLYLTSLNSGAVLHKLLCTPLHKLFK